MATKKTKKTTTKITRPTSVESSHSDSVSDKIKFDLENNQSYLNLILGALIVIVSAVLIFNYFNKQNQNQVGSGQQTENTQTQTADVSKDNLPGQYTVKDGDTLFLIAQAYYDDGNQFTKIVEENKIQDPNNLTVGQVITIPKLGDEQIAQASATPEATSAPTSSPEQMMAQATATPTPQSTPAMDQPVQGGTGGAENQTIWGEKISGNTYTVQEGDWLSKIAGRAYGDIMQYQKIAQANNIQNPDVIAAGTVIQIPR